MKNIILAQYVFTLSMKWKKKSIQVEMPPYDVKDKRMILQLMNDMDNIYSWCQDTFEEGKVILSQIYENEAKSNPNSESNQAKDRNRMTT